MNTETLHFKFLKVFCCVLLLQLGWSHALGAVTEANQTRQIQGVITDSQGEPYPAVNVTVKGTSIEQSPIWMESLHYKYLRPNPY